MTSVTVLTLADRAPWDAAHAEAGLPSQSWAYARGLAETGIDPRLAVVEAGGARLLLPFFERPIPGHDRTDIATLPGLSGAGVTPDSLAPFAAWSDYARDRGWVSGYIQLAVANHGLQALDPAHIRAHNVMFRFDLERWAFDTSVRKKRRWTIRAGDRMGAVLVTGTARLGQTFLDLHYPAMTRLGAASVFPPGCFAHWFQDPAVQLLGAEIDGRIEAVQLVRTHGIQAEIPLVATSEPGRELTNWLFWQATEHLRPQGVRYLNIGGYKTENDGIHRSKRRFNADEFPLLSLRQVYDQGAFDALCAAAGDRLAPGRFPPYRV